MSTGIRFTVAEHDRMIEQGVFEDRYDQRLELVHGEIREFGLASPAHEDTIDLLGYWSIDNTPRDKVRVRIQNSLGIPALDSVPQPDVAWMKARNYRTRRPQPQDVLLLVEVAESSRAYDRGEKAELYAESRIKDIGSSTWLTCASRCTANRAAARTGNARRTKSASRSSHLRCRR